MIDNRSGGVLCRTRQRLWHDLGCWLVACWAVGRQVELGYTVVASLVVATA
jgi:hypothetical protein